MTNDQLAVEVAKMKTEIGVYRKIIGAVAVVCLGSILTLGGWTLAKADEYAQLKRQVMTHEQRLEQNEKAIRKIQEDTAATRGDVRVINANTKNIQDGVNALRDVIKDGFANLDKKR